MNRSRTVAGRLRIASIACVLATSCSTTSDNPNSSENAQERYNFQSSSTCRGCHARLAEQHDKSPHAASYTNPMFQAQFTMEYLRQFHNEIDEFRQEPPCLACHAPMTYIESGYDEAKKKSMVFSDGKACDRCHIVDGNTPPEALQRLNPGGDPDDSSAIWRLTYVNPKVRHLATSGVGCDLCHTITAIETEPIGNGLMETTPGPTKYGPFKHQNEWHHAYAELQTMSEICAACHEATNRHGVPIRTTYTEWKESPQAAEGVQCQDCHMTVNGFLSENGTAEYESGFAALMYIGAASPKNTGPKYFREKLYTHRFVGAASHSQVEGAISLEIIPPKEPLKPGETIEITVLVNNSRTGHRFPTGSPELRSIRLELTAEIDGRIIPAYIVDEDEESLGVLGANDFDFEAFGNDIPEGARIYRAVLLDADGFETLSFYNATDLAFDNRLHAGEIREERFILELPRKLEGEVMLKAAATYLRYPSEFSARLGQGPSTPVLIAKTKISAR